jgi:hypothetical protein
MFCILSSISDHRARGARHSDGVAKRTHEERDPLPLLRKTARAATFRKSLCENPTRIASFVLIQCVQRGRV